MDKISNDIEVTLKRKANKVLNHTKGKQNGKLGLAEIQGKGKEREDSSQRGGPASKQSQSMNMAAESEEGLGAFEELFNDV